MIDENGVLFEKIPKLLVSCSEMMVAAIFIINFYFLLLKLCQGKKIFNYANVDDFAIFIFTYI